MKLIFELPDNMLSEEQADSLLSHASLFKQIVGREVERQLVAKYLETHPGFEGLVVTEEEVKKAVIDKMAERALERMED